MPQEAINYVELAKKVRLGENHLLFEVSDQELDLICTKARHRLERWGLSFKKQTIKIRSKTMGTQTIQINPKQAVGIAEDALLYTSINPRNGWNKEWIAVFDSMTKGDGQEKPMALVSIADHRQCWVNRAAANLFSSSGAEMVRRKVSRFWLPESLEELEHTLRTCDSGEFEISYQAYKNETSPDLLSLVTHNRIVRLDDEYYRLACNKASEIVTT